MKIFPGILLLLLFQTLLRAQEMPVSLPDSLDSVTPAGEVEQDTTDAGILLSDTTRKIVRTWIMTEDYTVMEDFDLDTAQTGFQIADPVYRQSISQAYLGSPGLQSRNNIYFNADFRPGFYFMRPFSSYMYAPETTVFYNITKPFTLLEYFASTGDRQKREEWFRAVHTQNVTPFLNLGFDIRLLGALGTYEHQKSKFNSVSLFSSYTGKDYSFYSSLHVNTQNAEENGGLKDDSLFIHTLKDERAYDVNLEQAESSMRNFTWHYSQRYRFGKMEQIPDTTSETGFRRLRERTTKTGSFIHNIEYQRNFRLYKDRISDYNRDFYPDYFIDPSATGDSAYFRSLSNMFQLMLDENPNRPRDFGARAFIRYDWVKYAHNDRNDTTISGREVAFPRRIFMLRPEGLQEINRDTLLTVYDTLLNNQRAYVYHEVSVGASFMHTVGEGWDWLASGRYFLTGYRASDLVLDGYITKRFRGKRGSSVISISGRFGLEEPDHFLNHYGSNHFRWDNDFRKTKDIRGSLVLSNQALRLRAKFDIALVSDLVYFDLSAHPVQHQGVVSLLSGEMKKDFQAGIFHSNHRLNYQLSSDNNVVRLPDFSYFTSTFLGFTVVRNALTAEFGFDFYYYTRYRALAFSPSSGSFYNQDVRELGNYPYLNLFLNAKLKRTRFYVRWDHPHAGLIKKNYYHVLNYPVRGRVFRFGLSWSFYD